MASLPKLDLGGPLFTAGGGVSGGTSSAPSTSTGGTASGMFDNSGFTVNYAPSIGVGGGSLPAWVWVAAAVVAGVFLWKRK